MRAKAFSPCHITGFFGVHINKNPVRSGSSGAGIVLDRGVTTEVKVEEAEKRKIEIHASSELCDCSVTESVIKAMICSSPLRIEVNHSIDMPMMQGFGVSGAGALSTAFALNKALELGFSDMELGRFAHIAEVENLTGLGDVIAELSGGFVVRKKAGAPGTGEVLKFEEEAEVYSFVVDSAISTKDILSDGDVQKKINSAAEKSLKILLESPSLENFLKVSREFSYPSGLMSHGVKDAVDILEAGGVKSSMCMLGGSIFSFSEEAEGLIDLPCIKANIKYEGAKLI